MDEDILAGGCGRLADRVARVAFGLAGQGARAGGLATLPAVRGRGDVVACVADPLGRGLFVARNRGASGRGAVGDGLGCGAAQAAAGERRMVSLDGRGIDAPLDDATAGAAAVGCRPASADSRWLDGQRTGGHGIDLAIALRGRTAVVGL